MARLAIPSYCSVHLRGLFYRIVAAANVRKPDGSLFVNTEDNWGWLAEGAAKAARWLGYVSWSAIRDNRHGEPRVFDFAGPSQPVVETRLWHNIDLPCLMSGAVAEVGKFAPRQPYRLVLLGEKSSLEEVLLPVAMAH